MRSLVMVVVCTVCASSLRAVLALPNGLGKLPGLGWNSDYCTNCSAWNRSSPGA